MSDEIPPAPSETSDDAAKAETIRITLPKSEQPIVTKRETVRINLPGKPASTGPGPKKETTKIVTGDPEATVASPMPPPPPAKPFVPPPPKPPGFTSGALKPVGSGVNPPPKPPSLGAKPTVPLKPTPAPTTVAKPVAPPGSGLNPAPEPMTQKATSPKKETARITLPPESKSGTMPKATIKMQQTQPLVKQPGASASQSALQPAPALTTTTTAAIATDSAPDGTVTILSIAALIISLASLALVFLAYNASSPT